MRRSRSRRAWRSSRPSLLPSKRKRSAWRSFEGRTRLDAPTTTRRQYASHALWQPPSRRVQTTSRFGFAAPRLACSKTALLQQPARKHRGVLHPPCGVAQSSCAAPSRPLNRGILALQRGPRASLARQLDLLLAMCASCADHSLAHRPRALHAAGPAPLPGVCC